MPKTNEGRRDGASGRPGNEEIAILGYLLKIVINGPRDLVTACAMVQQGYDVGYALPWALSSAPFWKKVRGRRP